MRPPGSNYKNYCSSKLLMSCDVLPTCEEGLGVEKACYPEEEAREGAPQAPRSPLTQAGTDQCTQTTNQTRKKTKARQPGGAPGSHRSGIKIRAFFPPKVSLILAPWRCRRAGVTGEP